MILWTLSVQGPGINIEGWGGLTLFTRKICPLGGADILFPWVNEGMAGCSLDSMLFVYSQTILRLCIPVPSKLLLAT